MGFATTIDVKVKGRPVQVAGGDFWEMKNFVSDWERWPGRKWDDENKVWELPPETTFADFSEAVQGKGWQLLVSEDEQINAEVATIEKFQKRVLWNAVEIRYRAKQQNDIALGYSYHSRSRKKAVAQSTAGCFYHALKYAQMPLEQLTEPQIATLKATLKRIDEAGCIPLEKLIFQFSIDPKTCAFDDETFAERIVPLSSLNMSDVPKSGNDYCVQKYACDLAIKHDVSAAFFPDVTVAERFSPSGKLVPVVVFQIRE